MGWTDKIRNQILTIVVSVLRLYAMRVEEISSTEIYVGQAPPGTTSAAAGWRISKIELTGGEWIVTWADGNDAFDNVWNGHAGLSYS